MKLSVIATVTIITVCMTVTTARRFSGTVFIGIEPAPRILEYRIAGNFRWVPIPREFSSRNAHSYKYPLESFPRCRS